MSVLYSGIRVPLVLSICAPILVIGVISNFIIAAVFGLRLSKSSPTFYFFMLLTLADLLGLLCTFLEELNVLHIWTGPALGSHNLLSCRLWKFVPNLAQSLSSYSLVVLSFERCMAIVAPFSHRAWISRRRALIISVTLFFICNAMSIYPAAKAHFMEVMPLHWMSSDNASDDSERIRWCNIVDSPAAINCWGYLSPILFQWLPTVLILLSNICVVVGLYRDRVHHFAIQNSNTSSGQRRARDRQITRFVLSISLLFLLLTFPYTFIIGSPWFEIRRMLGNGTDMALRDLCRVMLMLNHSINLFCYVGSRQFREAIRQVLRQLRFFQCSRLLRTTRRASQKMNRKECAHSGVKKALIVEKSEISTNDNQMTRQSVL